MDGQKIDVLVAVASDTVFYGSLTGIHRHPARRPVGIADAGPETVTIDGIDLRGAYLTGFEVDRAREIVSLVTIIAAADVKHACHPVLAAGVVIQSRPSKRNVSDMETIKGLLLNSILADPNSLFGGKPLASPLVPAAVHSTATLNIGITAIAAAPREIEGVASSPALGILNSNDCGSAVLRPANQLLAATPVHAGKPEVPRIGRYTAGAFEPAPLRSLPREIPECCITSANLHLCRPVNHNFNRALAPFRTATPRDTGPTLNCLAACGSGNRREGSHPDCD